MGAPRSKTRLVAALHSGFGLGASLLLAVIALANLASLLHRGERAGSALVDAADDLYVGSVSEAGLVAARNQAAEEA